MIGQVGIDIDRIDAVLFLGSFPSAVITPTCQSCWQPSTPTSVIVVVVVVVMVTVMVRGTGAVATTVTDPPGQPMPQRRLS